MISEVSCFNLEKFCLSTSTLRVENPLRLFSLSHAKSGEYDIVRFVL